MAPTEVYEVLAEKGVHTIYHANSVLTSLSFMEVQGLASRGYNETNGLLQTDQYTDNLDKHFGIWDDVFFDTVDIHNRISNRNQYGPVLFSVSTDFLLDLPIASRALISKKNPTEWHSCPTENDKYFLSREELANGLRIGDFGQMVIVRTPAKLIPFKNSVKAVVLDDPGVSQQGGISIFEIAKTKLSSVSPTTLSNVIYKRQCRYGCKCVSTYAPNGGLTEAAERSFCF